MINKTNQLVGETGYRDIVVRIEFWKKRPCKSHTLEQYRSAPTVNDGMDPEPREPDECMGYQSVLFRRLTELLAKRATTPLAHPCMYMVYPEPCPCPARAICGRVSKRQHVAWLHALSATCKARRAKEGKSRKAEWEAVGRGQPCEPIAAPDGLMQRAMEERLSDCSEIRYC